MPLPTLERIMYGPVRSRRLGTSLGINLLPDVALNRTAADAGV